MKEFVEMVTVDIRSTATKRDRFLVRVSFLEIYNERITDLLVRKRNGGNE